MTKIRISAAHRDALYDQILDRLSGIGDVWLAVAAEEYETATRLGREYSDDLRLLLDDLGWGDGLGRGIELTAPPDVLRRVFDRLGAAAAGQRLSEETELAEFRAFAERNQLVAEACEMVLAGLDGNE
jgi:hypothetical protein